MCGIIGILGRAPVAEQLVDSLKRLEYRGYDSAGVATLEGDHLERRRAEGKLKNLEARLKDSPLKGHTGIGHTRWATHGKPTENNAHPHATDNVAVVHNGIIENFRELRQSLENQAAKPTPKLSPISSTLASSRAIHRRKPSRRRCRNSVARSRSALCFAVMAIS
jgi:glutamine---fructose-6-phosphate transaminase (isomerizing)